MSYKKTPIQTFYNPANASDYTFDPQIDELVVEADAYRTANAISRTAKDIRMLIIDAQKDFCFPPPLGRLYVAGRAGKGAM